MAKAPVAASAAPRTFPVRLVRDYWPLDMALIPPGADRLAEGTVHKLPLDEAKAVIEAGIAERADALPE